jgi:triosephosphate isomerase (TIM)
MVLSLQNLQEMNMRIPLIAGNWKMNTTVAEAIKLVKEIRPEINEIINIEKVVCPPFISLTAIRDAVNGSSIKVGAQNLYYEEKGAFTGEISPLMLVDICEYVIIGHSERRQYFHETDELVRKKVEASIKNKLKPILCVGENLYQFESGQTIDIVTRQINSALAGLNQADTLTIAYEPVWAIGTGKAATGKQANDTINLIRSLIAKRYDSDIAQNIRILYGGSVTDSNISEFVSQSDIDGALVGGASLKAQEFIGIVKKTSQIRNTA